MNIKSNSASIETIKNLFLQKSRNKKFFLLEYVFSRSEILTNSSYFLYQKLLTTLNISEEELPYVQFNSGFKSFRYRLKLKNKSGSKFPLNEAHGSKIEKDESLNSSKAPDDYIAPPPPPPSTSKKEKVQLVPVRGFPNE